MLVFSLARTVEYNTDLYTVVNYTANYDLATALNNGPELIATINASVFDDLKDEEISGSAIDEGYLYTVASAELVKGNTSG